MIKGHVSPEVRALAKQCALELDIKIQATIENQMRRDIEAAEDAAILAAWQAGADVVHVDRRNLSTIGLRFP